MGKIKKRKRFSQNTLKLSEWRKSNNKLEYQKN